MKTIYVLSLIIFCTNAIAGLLPYKLGIENVSQDQIQGLKNKRIALVTNQTGKDSCGQRTIDLLLKMNLKLNVIFVPEHGLDGKIAAEKNVRNTIDQKTKIPVKSLYANGTGKKVDARMLKDVDVITVDLQDCGMRHYTYISTLYTVLEACVANNKKCVVFDRPNPLGSLMEGPLVESGLISFISIAPIPLRHGMTIGELARYFNECVLPKKAELEVVWMDNYDRSIGCAGILLSALSPNIASLQSCYGYSFLGLLGEVRPFDVGFSMQRPFQAILLPEKTLTQDQWRNLRLLLQGHGIESALVNKHPEKNNKLYEGVVVRILDVDTAQTFQALVAMFDYFKKLDVPLDISASFDKAIGTKKMREYITGMLDRELLVSSVNNDLQEFYAQARNYFYYKPLPQLHLLK